jgi:hypothetical protein
MSPLNSDVIGTALSLKRLLGLFVSSGSRNHFSLESELMDTVQIWRTPPHSGRADGGGVNEISTNLAWDRFHT